jgi:hypothetical protein
MLDECVDLLTTVDPTGTEEILDDRKSITFPSSLTFSQRSMGIIAEARSLTFCAFLAVCAKITLGR